MENNEDQYRIIYADRDLAVVYKGIGEVCERDEGGKSVSTLDVVKPLLEERLGIELSYLESVHRIDQPVTGCLLLALSPEVCADLSEQFKTGGTRKKYLAIIEKRVGETAAGGTLIHYLKFDQKTRKSYVLPFPSAEARGGDWKKAVLKWTVLGQGDRYEFMEIIPETGRTHQIRAQLSASGMVIKGDLKYGARRSEPLGGIRLHAYSIQFTHPVTSEVMTCTCVPHNPDPLWTACIAYLV